MRPWGKNCCPAGMDLVAPPTTSPKYSVTFSQASYTPCGIVTVSVDVLDKDFKVGSILTHRRSRSRPFSSPKSLSLTKPFSFDSLLFLYFISTKVPWFTSLRPSCQFGPRRIGQGRHMGAPIKAHGRRQQCRAQVLDSTSMWRPCVDARQRRCKALSP